MIFNFMTFVATKNGRTQKIFPSSFGAVFVSGIRDLRSGIRDKHPCAAHVCTLFSSTANLRESYGSQVYQGMQSPREEMWVGPSVTAR
jgi:hypothetical protein